MYSHNVTLANASARIKIHGCPPIAESANRGTPNATCHHHPLIKQQLIIIVWIILHINPRNLTLANASARNRASNSRSPSMAESAFRETPIASYHHRPHS